MAARKAWGDLSERTRRLIVIGAAAEGMLKAAAIADLRRRPASQVRGPRWLWAVVIVLVNSFGCAPLAYFTLGRRRPPPST